MIGDLAERMCCDDAWPRGFWLWLRNCTDVATGVSPLPLLDRPIYKCLMISAAVGYWVAIFAILYAAVHSVIG